MAIRAKTTVQLKAGAHGSSHSRTDVRVRDQALVIDEPAVRGGTDAGPAPTETALAALAGCTNVIAHKCAARLGVDIGHLDIEIACEFDRRGVTLTEEIDVPFIAIRQSVAAHGPAGEDDLRAVAKDVEKYCPLSKLFEGAGTKVETVWRKA